MNADVMFSKASDEWATPRDVFDALSAEFIFDLDAAATPHNNKCPQWLGPGSRWSDDALDASWCSISARGSVWLNPPYSRCREFIAKAVEEARKGCTVVCLIPSRTDTRWWGDYVWNYDTHQPRPGVEVRFLKGRLKFGNAKHGAPFPSVVVVFRPLTREQERAA